MIAPTLGFGKKIVELSKESRERLQNEPQPADNAPNTREE
jgi:hypothetical protein